MVRYIDADALKKKFYNVRVEKGLLGLNDIFDELDEAPTADVVERKKGEWICYDSYFACNQCRQLFTIDSNFCPMCGADMRGDKDE